MSKSIYMGAMIKVAPIKTEATEELTGCVNETCSKFHVEVKHEYCSGCGQPIKNYDKAIIEIVDFNEWLDINDFLDELSVASNLDDEEYQYGRPNLQASYNSMGVGIDEYDFYGVMEIGNIDTESYIQKFKTEYKEIIDVLDEDKMKYEVIFGFLSYYS